MKITRITLWRLPLTSHTPYYMSDGKACVTVDTVIVRLDTDCNTHGWGEVCPIPHYLPAYTDGVAPAIVMKIGGWKDLKVMQRYVRMAGVEVNGATENLKIMPPRQAMGRVVELYRS